jgi:hypothetical protein
MAAVIPIIPGRYDVSLDRANSVTRVVASATAKRVSQRRQYRAREDHGHDNEHNIFLMASLAYHAVALALKESHAMVAERFAADN